MSQRELDQCISSFNKGIKDLMKCGNELVKNDTEMVQLRSSIARALAVNDMVGIKMLGPVLFMYKEKILEGDVEFFLTEDLGNDSEFSSIIKKMRVIFMNCSEEKKQTIVDLIISLTTTYINYVILEKQRR